MTLRTDTVAIELAGSRLDFVEENGFVNTSVDLGWPEAREVAAAVQQVDGTVDATSRYGARAVTVNLGVVDTDGQTWNQALARLGLFMHVSLRPTLVFTVDAVEYRMTVVPVTGSAPFEFPTHTRAQLAFRAPDPYLHGATQTVLTAGAQAGTNGRTYPWEPPRIYPITNAIGGEVEAFNAGNAPVWPVVTIWGPLTAAGFSLTNTATGETFKMLGTTGSGTLNLEVGQRLVIDMRERTVRVNGDRDSPRFSFIDFTSSSWLHLHPGENLLRFVTDTGGLEATVAIEWSDPYLWPGGLTP